VIYKGQSGKSTAEEARPIFWGRPAGRQSPISDRTAHERERKIDDASGVGKFDSKLSRLERFQESLGATDVELEVVLRAVGGGIELVAMKTWKEKSCWKV
jgi:hypothetical protein